MLQHWHVVMFTQTHHTRERTRSPSGGEDANGYTFAGMDNSALNSALDRAIRTYQCAALPARSLLHDSRARDKGRGYNACGSTAGTTKFDTAVTTFSVGAAHMHCQGP